MRYFCTVNWVNCIMSCLIFPHHSVLLPTALGAQPTPLRSATLQHSNLQKNGCSQMPRKLAVGHIWLYIYIWHDVKSMYGCVVVKKIVLFIANLPSKKPTVHGYHWHLIMLERSIKVKLYNFLKRSEGHQTPQLTLASHKSMNLGKKHTDHVYHPIFVGEKNTPNFKTEKKNCWRFFFRFDLLEFMDFGVQPHQSNPKNSHTSWDPNDPSTSSTRANVRDALAWSPWLKLLTQKFHAGNLQ